MNSDYWKRPEVLKANQKRYYWENRDKVRARKKIRRLEKRRISCTRKLHLLKTNKSARQQTVFLDEKGNAYFSRKVLAKRAKMPTNTINTWEREKIIPPAIYKDTYGRRLYSENQIKIVKIAYDHIKGRRKVKKWKTEKASKYMYRRWKEDLCKK